MLGQITAQMAMTYRVVPVEYDAKTNKLMIAVDTADNFRATDDLRTLLGFTVEAMISDREALEKALELWLAAFLLSSRKLHNCRYPCLLKYLFLGRH